MKISQILKANKKTIIILLTINLISFFLPYFKQVEWECEKYYSYESQANYKYEYWFGFYNTFYYINIFIITVLVKNAVYPGLVYQNSQYEIAKFNKLSYIVFSIFYLIIYYLINIYMLNFPNQELCNYNKMGIGVIPNLLSTFLIIIISYRFRIKKINHDNWN